MYPKEVLESVALNEEEYRLIVERLGREPNILELGIIGSLWSEHCGYKHSKPLLKMLPSRGEFVITERGGENAGAVKIKGFKIVMKIESHNHPSAIEPFQGAATGVGGIVRDIFAMGARPIALLNSLRFGKLSVPRNRYLFERVVSGIAWYGNCLGIPDVGGEVFFDDGYNDNPLVNCMCVGITEGKLILSRVGEEGDVILLVGSDTGRDGIHGASGLASRTFEEEKELRPQVQVGNPFLEKLLLEACLEIGDKDFINGIQDLGAAGLAAASIEAAGRSGKGIEIDVLKVPRREKGMNPYEVMLSESQERMLVFVKKGYEDEAIKVFKKYRIEAAIIGRVINEKRVRIYEGSDIKADLPIEVPLSPPLYRRKGKRPERLDEVQKIPEFEDIKPEEVEGVFLKLLSSPNVCSREWVYTQYDHHVQINTVIEPGEDAALLRVKGEKFGIALVCDGDGRLTWLDPFKGGAISVCEASRNIVCIGAKPVAITDCLNFGNPENPEVYWELEECIKGMKWACEILDIPVISGNVSLYNETRGKPVYPTPVIGMLGIIEDMDKRCTLSFKDEGDEVFLAGREEVDLAGSEYLSFIKGMIRGKPDIDPEFEKRLQEFILKAIDMALIKSAHDVSKGGLIVALAECSIKGDKGFSGYIKPERRLDEELFGETPSRVVLSTDKGEELEKLAKKYGIPLKKLGVVKEEPIFEIKGLVRIELSRIKEVYEKSLEDAVLGGYNLVG